jgi:poly(beta-D-mannuronate) lyase
MGIVSSLFACQTNHSNKQVLNNIKELEAAIENAKPGDELIMANGVWNDVQIRFTSKGTAENPIVLRAETPGKVSIEGVSDLKFGGEYLIVKGLYFKNGYTPSSTVIDFKVTKNSVANHCQLTQCVIENFNQKHKTQEDHWVEFWGRNNQMDHCYIGGKSNGGPTVRVEIKGNQNIKNHHKIIHNHFGPRPRLGGPRGETIQLGDSYSSMSPSNTMVANNLFEECNGEIEVISSKTNFNEFRNNVFYKCEGSMVTRHGNYCIIDGNFFLGDGRSENMGGIRLINTGHWVTNNYFFNMIGENFRSPLAVMNGIPKSPLNRYNQVTDVVVAYNSWINCKAPLNFGVGVNLDQKDVLPASEIRSARPIRVVLANNLIYNENEQKQLLIEHDKADGVTFKNNVANTKGNSFEKVKGIEAMSLEMNKLTTYLWAPSNLAGFDVYKGFEFETISQDMLGNKRDANNIPGAICNVSGVDSKLLDKTQYGATWFSNEKMPAESKTHAVSVAENNLVQKLLDAADGDVIELEAGEYRIAEPLIIAKTIRFKSKDSLNKAQILYQGEAGSALFEMHPFGNLSLNNVLISGSNTQNAFAPLANDMSNHYNIHVQSCSISNFDYVVKAYKESFADSISFDGTSISNCSNGIVLAAETNDRGDYNVEFLSINQCKFTTVKRDVINYYRGGYDESTIGGNLNITGNTFTQCGSNQSNGILLNHWGIVNVDISGNHFTNNPVKLVAQLWGAKNNTHSDNTFSNSGKLIVEQNLKQKMMY